ncbi:MAG: hypothetical protein ABEH64_00300 [Salinirussus sp.]
MGRTNPTFRDVLERTREEYRPFRRGLRATQQSTFDALFDDAATHADAAGYMNAREPMHPIFLAMLLAQKRELHALEERVEALEDV